MQTNSIPLWERLYRPIALLLLAIGFLAMFSIGLPFFFLGLAMSVLWPLRGRRRLFASLFVGVFVLIIVGVLVAPLGCTATATLYAGDAPREGSPTIEGRTTCENLLGLTYEGAAGYNAQLWPAVATGFTAGTLVAVGTYLFLSSRRSAYNDRRGVKPS